MERGTGPYPPRRPQDISTLKKILTAPRLAGILVYSGREVGRTDYIEPIIDEPTLRRLQAKMNARKASRARLDRQLLTGILVCGKCSTLLNSTIKGSRTPARVYSCRNCGGVSINGAAVENVMTDALFRALQQGGADAVQSDGADTNAQVLAELAFLDDEEAALADASADLPVSVLRAKGASILKRRNELRKRLGITQEVLDAHAWYDRADEVRAAWDSYSTDKKRNVMIQVLGRMKVFPGDPEQRHTRTDRGSTTAAHTLSRDPRVARSALRVTPSVTRACYWPMFAGITPEVLRSGPARRPRLSPAIHDRHRAGDRVRAEAGLPPKVPGAKPDILPLFSDKAETALTQTIWESRKGTECRYVAMPIVRTSPVVGVVGHGRGGTAVVSERRP